MNNERASMFEDEDGDVDVSGFEPKPASIQPLQADANVRALAEQRGFPPRDPIVPPVKREQRRHRTGRNYQLSLKTSRETADLFYSLADECGEILGVTFEHAVAALRRERRGEGT